jgi:hypothetical protein
MIAGVETAAEPAQTLGIKVYTIGVGTRGVAKVPGRDQWGQVRYFQQKVDIDEETLTEMAKRWVEDISALDHGLAGTLFLFGCVFHFLLPASSWRQAVGLCRQLDYFEYPRLLAGGRRQAFCWLSAG